MRALANHRLNFKPGERFSYSAGPFIIGMVIQKVTGEPYARYMQERIFDPLGMTATHINDSSRIVPHRAAGYVFKDGALENGVRISPAAEARGDVGVQTTALDLAKWATALDDKKLLKESSLQAMFSLGQLNNGLNVPYGFGWWIDSFRGHLTIWHSGEFRTGFNSVIDRYIDDKLTVIILANLQTAHAYSMGRTVAGFYNSDYRSISSMNPQRDPNPQRTLKFRRFFNLLADGRLKANQTIEHFPIAYYDQERIRSLIKDMKSFSFVDCQNMLALTGPHRVVQLDC